jgi:hypothetical protein
MVLSMSRKVILDINHDVIITSTDGEVLLHYETRKARQLNVHLMRQLCFRSLSQINSNDDPSWAFGFCDKISSNE